MSPSGRDDLTVERIEEALDTEFLGRPVQVFPVTVSTEALAMSWARQHDAPEGALVVAEMELSARGRRGAVWASLPGKTLAFSVVLRPALPPEGEGLLWLLGSLGAAEGIAACSGLDVALKWPNDVLVDGRRIAGVKLDAQLEPGRIASAVVTVRANVGVHEDDLPPDVRASATSLAMHGASVPRVDVLAAVLAALEGRYGAPVADLLDAYRARCDTIGRRVRAELMPVGEATGQAVDVNEQGGLVVKTSAGEGALTVDVLRRLIVE